MYIGKNYYSQAPMYQTLTQHSMDQIHMASMRVLQEKGMVLQHPEAVEMLKKAGATVKNGDQVFMPRSLVEWAIAQAPSGITIFDRNGEPAMFLEDRNVYFGTGSDTLLLFDYETKEGNTWTKEQMTNAVRLADALPNIDHIMSMGCFRDGELSMIAREQYSTMIKNSTKPHVVVCETKEELEDVFNMYIAVRGSKEELRLKPYAVVYNEPTSPLVNTKEAIEKLLLCADYGMPSNYATGGLAGATTPVTAAGTIVLSNAECLFGLVIQQVYKPGSPFVYGYCNSPMDMKTVQSCYALPLALQIQNGMCDMARYYKLPSWGEAGDSCSKICDEQSAMEATQLLQMAAIQGCNLIHDVGYMNFGLGYSLEHLVICDEIISRVKESMKGVEVTEETLSVNSILKVPYNGDFLRDKLTMKSMRSLWTGELSDFNTYQVWQKQDSTTMGQRAHEKVKRLLETHNPKPLDQEIVKAIDDIVDRARK